LLEDHTPTTAGLRLLGLWNFSFYLVLMFLLLDI